MTLLIVILVALVLIAAFAFVGYLLIKLAVVVLLVTGGLALILIYAPINAALGSDMEGTAVLVTIWVVTFIAFVLTFYRSECQRKDREKEADAAKRQL